MPPQTTQQRKFFEDNGYLVLEGLLKPQDLADCLREIQRLHHVAAEMEAKGDPNCHLFQLEPFAKDKINPDGLPILRKIEETYRFSPLFAQLAAHPGLVPVVQDLMDKDLLLFRSTLMLKPAFHGSIHALHQDSAYWPMRPPRQLTVSIALTDATVENGCFQVIPKSHTWGLLPPIQISRAQNAKLTDVEGVDTSNLTPVPLKAGSALLFHSMLMHGSGPNTSSHPRSTALYAYFPPNVTYTPREGEPREKTFRVIAGLGGKREHTLVAEPVKAGNAP